MKRKRERKRTEAGQKETRYRAASTGRAAPAQEIRQRFAFSLIVRGTHEEGEERGRR